MHRLSDELQTILATMPDFFSTPQYSHLPVNPVRIKHKAAELPVHIPIQEFPYLIHFSLMGLSALLLQNQQIKNTGTAKWL